MVVISGGLPKRDLEVPSGPRSPGGSREARAFYEADLTDAEWAVIRPLMPEPASR
jgi:hypothetical protein